MKHLKTFESFEQPAVNEEFLNFGKKAKAKKFREELDKFIHAYSKRMDAPTEEEIQSVMDQAEKDKFEGKPGLTEVDGEKKISYRDSKSINWKTKGHTFGSGE